jgi:RNA polymerase sigma-70 factor (ECF subfamily)
MTTIQFQEKILSIQKNMFSFAMMLTTNRYDAEDLLQETTLRVLDNKNKYVDNTNFKGWVLTIMRNIFINNYRKELRSQIIIDQIGDLHHLIISEDSYRENPETTMNVKEIKYSINNLNDELKIPLSMYLDGYKYNEISDKLALPLGTVKSRIFFARRELKRDLTGKQYSN